MKKTRLGVILLLVLGILLGACSGGTEEVPMTEPEEVESPSEGKGIIDGNYEKTVEGHSGPISIRAEIEDGVPVAIEILDSVETDGVGGKALSLITDAMVEHGTIQVDSVAGATTSSLVLKHAMKEIFLEAGATEEDLELMPEVSPFESLAETEYDYDVVVIGGGGAGLSAAITAKQNGASVAIIEKNGFAGGNTMVSGGGLNVAGSDLQEKMGIEDNIALFTEDTLIGGDNENDPELVSIMTEHALESYEWLRDDIGVKFIQDRVQQFGGHTVPRACVPEGNKGYSLTKPLLDKCEELDIDIFYDTKASHLVETDGQVNGVLAQNQGEEIRFNASKGVVLATGGFGANVEMREKYNDTYGADYMTTCLSSSQGDGILMAEELDVKLVDMAFIQVYPTCNPLTGILSYVANSRFDGALLVNQEGKRFVNESDRRDVISQAILNQTDNIAYLVWGQDIETVGNMTQLHDVEYVQMEETDVIFKADSLGEAAEHYGIDPEALIAEIEEFNGFVDAEEDPNFFKTGAYRKIEEGPFYIQKVAPSTHHTMGGVAINEKAQVLNEDNAIIPGLYAAGEVVGGIHGTNRLGGNAITDVITFGRIAGREVSQ